MAMKEVVAEVKAKETQRDVLKEKDDNEPKENDQRQKRSSKVVKETDDKRKDDK